MHGLKNEETGWGELPATGMWECGKMGSGLHAVLTAESKGFAFHLLKQIDPRRGACIPAPEHPATVCMSGRFIS